jgi:hypothetical protein
MFSGTAGADRVLYRGCRRTRRVKCGYLFVFSEVGGGPYGFAVAAASAGGRGAACRAWAGGRQEDLPARLGELDRLPLPECLHLLEAAVRHTASVTKGS